jgi:hypothetical protein
MLVIRHQREWLSIYTTGEMPRTSGFMSSQLTARGFNHRDDIIDPRFVERATGAQDKSAIAADDVDQSHAFIFNLLDASCLQEGRQHAARKAMMRRIRFPKGNAEAGTPDEIFCRMCVLSGATLRLTRCATRIF